MSDVLEELAATRRHVDTGALGSGGRAWQPQPRRRRVVRELRQPQKELVQAVREAVLDSDPRVQETIKWSAPTFTYEGNIASFYPRAKRAVSLLFHTGASLPDPDGLLEGEGDTSRVARFADAADLATKREGLQRLVRAWIESRPR